MNLNLERHSFAMKPISLLLFLILLQQVVHSRDSDYIPPEHIHLSLSEDPTMVNVVWTTFPHPEDSINKPAYVEYGETKKGYPYFSTAVSRRVTPAYGGEEETVDRISVIHAAKMIGLKPSTHYWYRVGSPENNWSKDYQFISPPQNRWAENAHVRFAAFGDMGIFEPGLQTVELLEKQVLPAKDPYNFLIHVGDLAYAFGNWTKWDTWFNRIQRLATAAPYMISPGNRDETEFVKERFVMPLADNTVSSYFSTQGADQKSFYLSYDKNKPYLYYSFDYGFIAVISVSIKDDYTKNSEQYAWLERTLQMYSKRVSDSSDPLQWIMVIGHTPLYSSSDGHTGGNKELKDSIEQLLVTYGVHLAVWGDDHNYERTWPVYNNEPDTEFQTAETEMGAVSVFSNLAKPIHLLVGTAGIGLDGWQNATPPQWSAYREINHGFVEFDVTEEYVKGKFVRSKDHSVGDQFWIVKQNTIGGRRQIVLFVGVAVFLGIVLFLVKERNINLPLPMSRKHT